MAKMLVAAWIQHAMIYVMQNIPTPESVSNPVRHIHYEIVLGVSFLAVGWIILGVLGGGFEILILVPVAVVALPIVVAITGKKLRNSNSNWGTLLLSVFVICMTLILVRITTPGIADSPQPFYTVGSLSYVLFKEVPTLPNSYESLASVIFIVSLIYLVGALYFIIRSSNRNRGKTDMITSAIVIVVPVILLSLLLWPISDAWAKSKSPEHEARMKELQINAVYSDYSAYKKMYDAGRTVFFNSDGTQKSFTSYETICSDVAFIKSYPDIICRADNDHFIMYFKTGDQKYACSDLINSDILVVDTEPAGFSCLSGPRSK